MKVYLAKNIEFDFDTIFMVNSDGAVGLPDGYVQTSETKDVEFTMISDVDLNSAKVDAIDDKIEKAEAGIYLLKQARAELLAIPDMRGK